MGRLPARCMPEECNRINTTGPRLAQPRVQESTLILYIRQVMQPTVMAPLGGIAVSLIRAAVLECAELPWSLPRNARERREGPRE